MHSSRIPRNPTGGDRTGKQQGPALPRGDLQPFGLSFPKHNNLFAGGWRQYREQPSFPKFQAAAFLVQIRVLIINLMQPRLRVSDKKLPDKILDRQRG